MIWWWVKLTFVVAAFHVLLGLAGFDPEGFTLEWWVKVILVGLLAYAIVGPSEDY